MRSFIRPVRALRATRIASRPLRPAFHEPVVSHETTTSTARLICPHTQRRSLHATRARPYDQGKPPAEPPATDFGALDVLGSTPVPATSVDVCMHDGFGLNSGLTISGGSGALLVNGEAFAWRPWKASEGGAKVVNAKGQFELSDEAFGLFDVMWPRPDLLVLGVGKHIVPLSPKTRQHIAKLGMRVEVLDTRNAAAQFNLLATERGVVDVAAALIPLGWQDGVGITP